MKTILKKYVVKTWDELTKEEKEKEKERYYEEIESDWYDVLYNDFKESLSDIQDRYKNIKFDDIYLDDNSQGWWIDRIKNFNYQVDGLYVYDVYIRLYDIGLTIHKIISHITEDDIIIADYNIDSDELKKIKATKKYQKWVNDIVEDVNKWIDEINEVCINYMNDIYDMPDYFIEDYFINNDIEFEYYVNTIESEQVNDTLYYLSTHNKNYNNKQYEKIIELKEMFEE